MQEVFLFTIVLNDERIATQPAMLWKAIAGIIERKGSIRNLIKPF
jgi:hypothetical protein